MMKRVRTAVSLFAFGVGVSAFGGVAEGADLPVSWHLASKHLVVDIFRDGGRIDVRDLRAAAWRHRHRFDRALGARLQFAITAQTDGKGDLVLSVPEDIRFDASAEAFRLEGVIES